MCLAMPHVSHSGEQAGGQKLFWIYILMTELGSFQWAEQKEQCLFRPRLRKGTLSFPLTFHLPKQIS